MSEDTGEGKEFEVETPVGKLKARGYHFGNVLQMVIAALLAVGVYMAFEMRNEARTSWAGLATAAKAEHAALAISLDRQTESQEEMNYILTLSPQDRERLNLSMPKSLRQKIIQRDSR